MGYLITRFHEGGTKEQYEATAEAVHPPTLPTIEGGLARPPEERSAEVANLVTA